MIERTFRLLPYASLSQAALDSIRDAILTGKLKPGERILESRVAAELGISRAPVREAIRQLASEGLLVCFPHRGTFVAGFSAEDAKEVYSLRAVLEGLAASLVAQDPDKTTLAALEACVGTMQKRAETNDIAGLIEADMRFHETLCVASKHRRLIAVWHSMSTQIRAFVSLSNRQYLTPDNILARHRAVLKAMRDGQGEQARQLLSSDILEIGQYLGARLRTSADKLCQRKESDHA